MKIAFVLIHPFSESMGSVVRVRALALSLGAKNVESYIFTPYERSFDLTPNVHVISLSRAMNYFGVSSKIYHISKALYYNQAFPSLFSKFSSKPNVVVTRIVNNLVKLITALGIDVVQIEQDAALPIAVLLKGKVSIPVILDIHNISSEELVSVGLLEKSSKKYESIQDTTKNGLSLVDHVNVVSEPMKDYVMKHYGLSEKSISIVPPGGSININCPSVKSNRNQNVVYAGLVAPREHVDLFVNSMPYVLKTNPLTKFFITNKGESINSIKKLADKLKVEPTFFWYKNYSEVNYFLSSCKVGILTSSNDLARQMGTPVKLFTYLSAGLPIVANEIGGWSEIIETEKVGLLSPDSPKEFGEILSALLADPALIEECALNGYELIKRKYNWDKSAELLLNSYNILLEKN